jgi:hypothetical protein
MSTKSEFHKTYNRVNRILDEEPDTRNDDKLLTLRVIEQIACEEGFLFYFPRELLLKIPAFETVKRTRAKIQNDESRYLPTRTDVIARRQLRADAVREWSIDGDVR